METLELPKFSFSQLGVWDRCHYMWKLSYIDQWIPKEKKNYFELGSLVHELLAYYYSGLPWKDQDSAWNCIRAYTLAEMQNPKRSESVEHWKTALRLMERYIHDFAPYKDKKWIVLEVEKHMQVQLTTPHGREYLLEGIIDLLISDEFGKVWLIDHKTGTKFWSQLAVLMDPQLPTYGAILRQLGTPIFGVMINMLNTYDYKKPSEVEASKLFRRESTMRPDVELDHIFHQTGLAVDEVLAARDLAASDPEAAFRKSLTKECGSCQFQQVCWFEAKGAPVNDILNVMFKKKEKRENPREESVEDGASV